jgi:putative photosynthetic complex assembly protein
MPRSPREPVPALPKSFKIPLIAAAGVVLFALMLVATAPRPDGHGLLGEIGPVVANRSLLFADTPAGDLVVIDSTTRQRIHVYGIGEGAFVRATIRALIAQRATGTASRDDPFYLLLNKTGRLLLLDPISTRLINLNAFGDIGQQSFSPLLTAQPDVVADVSAAVRLRMTSLED